MDSYPGGQSDWATILQMLKAEDEMLVYQGAMELRDALSYAQENQMHGFAADEYVTTLVGVVKRDPLTDLSNEVKFFAVQCLTTLMDITPTLVNALVHAGLPKAMVDLIKNSLGFLDLAEACLRAFEKISMENPVAVLRSGVVAAVLEQMDFFELSTQQRVFRIIQKIARHSTSEADLDTHILPVLPYICLSLGADSARQDPKKVEDASQIICEVQESFCLFYSPCADFARISAQYDKLLAAGVFDIVLGNVHLYAETQAKLVGQRGRGLSEAGNEIDSTPATQRFTQQTMTNLFKLLENASRYSARVAGKLVGESSLLEDLPTFLPGDAHQSHAQPGLQSGFDEYLHITEAVNLLHSLISEKEAPGPENESEGQKARRVSENQKREYQLAAERRPRLALLAERLLPRVLSVYETSINPHFRLRTLQVIDKTVSLLDAELLKSFVEPSQFANFVLQILHSHHGSSIAMALQVARRVLECSPMTHAVPLIREGASQLVKDLSTASKFKAYMGIPESTDITQQGFDLDIHEAKEALHHVRLSNPDDHAARDFFERRLLELVEKQKQAQAAEKKLAQSVALGEAGQQEDELQSSSPQDTNFALRIISEASGLLADYFENSAFLEQLRSHSEQTKLQLSLLDELSQLAADLCQEACLVQASAQDLAGLCALLGRVAGLLTLDGCTITSHEFKQSNLLLALTLLLTKSPSQARVVLERQRQKETGEEMKRAEELDLLEAQRQSKQLSKKESQCVMLRLRTFASVLLRSRSGSQRCPLRALIELSQRVISENDATLAATGAGSPSQAPAGAGLASGLGGLFGGPAAHGDYEHCMNALRQLQKRVTVCLIYDPKKEHQKQRPPQVTQTKDEANSEAKSQAQTEERPLEAPDLDSEMEDLSKEQASLEKLGLDLAPQALKKKGVSHHPALLQLAASPQKDAGPHTASTAIVQQKLNSSRVYLKRHALYSELGQIPVTVEQSTCLQLLEDFLRNKVKTADQVRGLKLDYGLGAFGTAAHGGPAGAGGSLFAEAFGSHYSSAGQKILTKSLEEPARKLLDAANERLSKILSGGPAVRIKAPDEVKLESRADGQGEAMEGVETGRKSEHEEEGSHSDGYGDIDEDEEELEAADLERQRLLDTFVEELPEAILSADIPDDQKEALAKLLTRQHAFMMDVLKARLEEAAEGEDWGEGEEDRQEELERLEDRLDDYQETMERVQAHLLDKLAERKAKNKAHDSQSQAKEQASAKAEGDKQSSEKKVEDQEMADESEPNSRSAEEEKVGDGQKAEEPSPKEKAGSQSSQAKPALDEPGKSELEPTTEAGADKHGAEVLLEDELAEHVLQREKIFMEKLKGIKQALQEKGAVEPNEVSEQTQEILTQDLEELIKQQGEDIDFAFYYEGKRILPHQSMFEIVKESEAKARMAERVAVSADKLRKLQAKEEELRKRAKRLAEAPGAEPNEADLAKLKQERDKLRELLRQVNTELGGSLRPQGLLGGLNAHRVYFSIEDKSDEVAELKRQRLDSLAELTNSALGKRGRTKSEAVRDISSGSIGEFVQQLLEQEFKVFDEEDTQSPSGTANDAGTKAQLRTVDEEMLVDQTNEAEDKGSSKAIAAANTSAGHKEAEQLGQSLKLLKVVHFLYSHQDLISDRGMRLVVDLAVNMGPNEESSGKEGEPLGPEFGDLELHAGFAALSPGDFHHHKLDSYLQRSIKDPYNLVQGAISDRMQQIFSNCPFLFPFSTKQLYFRLVSFISSIDVHRAIYFLRQYLRQSGEVKVQAHEKDNLRKIAKQKVLIHRDKLIPSAFALIQKIDKRAFLEFEFAGEAGVGLGPTLEFYDNIADEFRAWSVTTGEGQKYPMWRECTDNLLFPYPVCLACLPAETTKQVYEVFRLCGTIVAKAIVDDRQVDLPISPLFWRLCLGAQLSIFDMQKLDVNVFNTLAEFSIVAKRAAEVDRHCETKRLSEEVKKRQLRSLTLSKGARVEDYGLVFTLPCFDDIELIHGGKERNVELDNVQDYVDLVLHYSFHETVKLQIQAFKKGFDAIFPISSLRPFTHPQKDDGELEMMICGVGCNGPEWSSKQDLMEHVIPDHGYTQGSEQYKHFIRYINELEAAARPAFLKFLTGSKRLPLGGFKGLSPPLTLVLKKEHAGQSADEVLPSVMACQNYVKVPQYSSYEAFKRRFDYAVEEGQQNFLLS